MFKSSSILLFSVYQVGLAVAVIPLQLKEEGMSEFL